MRWKGITFAPFAKQGSLTPPHVMDSLRKMKQTGANFVILVPQGVQKNAYSEEICFKGEHCASDAKWIHLIEQAHQLGLRVALKPTVNCLDGTWRAHIRFFDSDVPCEPKWSNWFESYTKFQLHYAQMAQDMGCEMFIAGCEMVQTEHRANQWRQMLSEIRKVYTGLLSYNTDKYQEHNVPFWDAVDVISSSGYYPIDDMDNQLDRIEKVVQKYQKPFFFAEAGCMSAEKSSLTPNDWTLCGAVALQEQADWYERFFSCCAKRPWVQGVGLWDWPAKLYDPEQADQNGGYAFYAKPAETVIQAYFANKSLKK